MSAQPGGAILLGYGLQPGAAQSGAAVLLEYAATGPVRTTLRSGLRVQWSKAIESRTTVVARTSTTSNADARANAPWSKANPSRTAARSSWGVASAVDRVARAPWGAFAVPVKSPTTSAWGISRNADRAARAPWGVFAEIAAVAGRSEWGISTPADTGASLPWGTFRPMAHKVVAIIRRAHHIAPHWVLPWTKYSRTLRPGWGIITPDGEPPRDENGTILVPIRESYIVLNTVYLRLVPSGNILPAEGLTLSLSTDSWTWGFSASLPGWAMSLVLPNTNGDPVEVEADINGEAFRLIVESVSRSREFGNTAIQVSGRGRSAFLSDPFSPVLSRENTEARTARQLMEDALTFNGVPIGWTVDWGITDWLVPAGVWANSGTYMAALTEIANAAGAYVQPHATDAIVRVLPRYPVLPWEWGTVTPDVELPTAVAVRDSISWKDLPPYNRVFVSGASAGVLGRVTRTGTAGNLAAPMFVHPLITHADAARQKGEAILGETGRIATENIIVPVLEDVGVVTPGTFVRYADGADTRIGLVRGVSVAASLDEVWQTLEVETHG